MPRTLSRFRLLPRIMKRFGAVPALILSLFAAPALADGIPLAWGLNLQPPGSPIASRIYDFHIILLWIITVISVLVLGLQIYIAIRYNKTANPVPSTRTHNVKLEILWTLVPCFILLGLAWVSFPLLYYSDRIPTPDLTLKVTGHQWYWSYEYPDNGDIAFDSHAIWDSPDVKDDAVAGLIKESQPGWLIKGEPMRLLEVDNRIVLPVGKVVRVQITSGDVEHSWYLPALAVNRMAVPGRLNELWLKVDHEGVYYGQCSMICGNGHAYMPIVIEGVSEAAFDGWAKSKKTATGQATPSSAIASIQ